MRFSKVLIQAGYECDSSERRIDSGTVWFCKKTQDDALALKVDYEQKLEQANVKADQIILAARDQAKEEHENAILETQAKTDRMIEKAKADIEKEQKQAQQEVQGEIAKLALIAARKIIETGEAHDAEGSK